jgi:hypothetical protein
MVTCRDPLTKLRAIVAGAGERSVQVHWGVSVANPWAALLVGRGEHGEALKGVELRTWAPRWAIGERLAICASMTLDREAMSRFGLLPSEVIRGAIAGYASLSDIRPAVPGDAPRACVPAEDIARWIVESEAKGRTLWAWEMAEGRSVSREEPPIVVKGAVGRLLDLSALNLSDRPPAPERPVRRDWQASADRANARVEQREPLFVATGITPRRTAADRQAQIEGGQATNRAHQAELDAGFLATAEDLRDRCRDAMDPATFAEWERRWASSRWTPRSPPYLADHWRQAARAAGLEPDPRGEHAAALARVREGAAQAPVQLGMLPFTR